MREDLREQALRVLPQDIDFGDIDEYPPEEFGEGDGEFDNENNAYDDGSDPQRAFYNKNNLLKDPMFGKGRNMIK
jgi:hypothetical protein